MSQTSKDQTMLYTQHRVVHKWPIGTLTNTPTKRGMQQTPLKSQSKFPSAAGKVAMQTSCQLECVKYKAVQYLTHSTVLASQGIVRSTAAVCISYTLIEQMVRSRYTCITILRPVRSCLLHTGVLYGHALSQHLDDSNSSWGGGVAARTTANWSCTAAVFSMTHSGLGYTCAVEENFPLTCRLAVARKEGQQECHHTTNADCCPCHHLGFQRDCPAPTII